MTRTALEIVQDASLSLGIEKPTALFSQTDRTLQEVAAALNRAAERIANAHDWQALKSVETHTGDGSTTEFALPTDYLRMPKDAKVWSSVWKAPLPHITPEQWLMLDVRSFNPAPGAWTIYGGNFVYTPALTSTETARFFYISENACLDSGSTAKASFTADDDTFRLDDRVLELMLIAEYRSQKGLDLLGFDVRAVEALSLKINRDKGARIITQGGEVHSDAKIAFPYNVSA